MDLDFGLLDVEYELYFVFVLNYQSPERCAEELPYAQLAQAELSPARILAAVRGAAVKTLGDGRQRVEIRLVKQQNAVILPGAAEKPPQVLFRFSYIFIHDLGQIRPQ